MDDQRLILPHFHPPLARSLHLLKPFAPHGTATPGTATPRLEPGCQAASRPATYPTSVLHLRRLAPLFELDGIRGD